MKILIASTEKTGNTWLKLLLAHIYELPATYLLPDFSVAQADSLGDRWIAHQHFLPEPSLLAWAAAKKVRLLTTIRHPASTLVSLYHYCHNYPQSYEHEYEIAHALKTELPTSGKPADDRVTDGELIRILQRRLMCDLCISISWMVSGWSTIVRYEELHSDPIASLGKLTASIHPVSTARIEEAIKQCQLETLREKYATDRGFFRRGSIAEWRTVLPMSVCRRFVEDEPYKSQCSFLGYDLRSELGDQTKCSIEREKGARQPIVMVPILRQLVESIGLKKEPWFPEHLLTWANAPVEADLARGQSKPPLISNLAAFIHRLRPDLQSVFPDIFDANRLGYATWFLRYAHYAYQLDQRFFTPVVLSWLRKETISKTTMG